jgi:hypothetical protein
MKKIALTLVALATMAYSGGVFAESNINTGPGPNTATARLDFSIVIPRVLFLQVGTGTNLANNTAIDLLTFTVPPANLGDNTAVAGTGGNLAAGKVTVKVLGNAGDIGLTATTTGALSDGLAGDSIPWSEIAVATAVTGSPSAGYLATAIPHPAIPATGTGASTSITATNKVIRQEGIWTFTYKNTVAYAAGTYGGAGAASPGAGVNNGRIVYTATLP